MWPASFANGHGAEVDEFGVRWQGGSRDTTLGRAVAAGVKKVVRPCESGVALRFPPQSKTRWVV